MSKKTTLPGNPFASLQLTTEEQELEDVLAREEYQADPDFAQTELLLRDAAKHYRVLQSTKPVTIRLNQMDLLKIKAKAQQHDLPYQTLISSIIHQYVQGKYPVHL